MTPDKRERLLLVDPSNGRINVLPANSKCSALSVHCYHNLMQHCYDLQYNEVFEICICVANKKIRKLQYANKCSIFSHTLFLPRFFYTQVFVSPTPSITGVTLPIIKRVSETARGKIYK